MPVVDASVVVDWVSPTVGASAPAVLTLRRLRRDNADLIAPRLLLEEVANALLTGIKRRMWSGAGADDAFSALVRLPVRFVDTKADLDRAWDLARRFDDHPIYDMLYVAVAERTRSELITADDALRRRLKHLPWIVGPDSR